MPQILHLELEARLENLIPMRNSWDQKGKWISVLHGNFHRKTIPTQSKLFPQHVLATGQGGPHSAERTEKGYNFSHSEKKKNH